MLNVLRNLQVGLLKYLRNMKASEVYNGALNKWNFVVIKAAAWSECDQPSFGNLNSLLADLCQITDCHLRFHFALTIVDAGDHAHWRWVEESHWFDSIDSVSNKTEYAFSCHAALNCATQQTNNNVFVQVFLFLCVIHTRTHSLTPTTMLPLSVTGSDWQERDRKTQRHCDVIKITSWRDWSLRSSRQRRWRSFVPCGWSPLTDWHHHHPKYRRQRGPPSSSDHPVVIWTDIFVSGESRIHNSNAIFIAWDGGCYCCPIMCTQCCCYCCCSRLVGW